MNKFAVVALFLFIGSFLQAGWRPKKPVVNDCDWYCFHRCSELTGAHQTGCEFGCLRECHGI